MLKGSTVKEVNILRRQMSHSISLINVQPEENGMSSYGNTIARNFDVWFGMLRKTKRKYPTVIPFHGILTYDLVCWGKLLESKNCNAAPMWRFLCAMQLKRFKCWRPKKIGLDWPRPSRFQKNFQRVKVQNRKIGVDRSRESQKKGLFSGKCL